MSSRYGWPGNRHYATARTGTRSLIDWASRQPGIARTATLPLSPPGQAWCYRCLRWKIPDLNLDPNHLKLIATIVKGCHPKNWWKCTRVLSNPAEGQFHNLLDLSCRRSGRILQPGLRQVLSKVATTCQLSDNLSVRRACRKLAQSLTRTFKESECTRHSFFMTLSNFTGKMADNKDEVVSCCSTLLLCCVFKRLTLR